MYICYIIHVKSPMTTRDEATQVCCKCVANVFAMCFFNVKSQMTPPDEAAVCKLLLYTCMHARIHTYQVSFLLLHQINFFANYRQVDS
jgi:hypothetical protein